MVLPIMERSTSSKTRTAVVSSINLNSSFLGFSMTSSGVPTPSSKSGLSLIRPADSSKRKARVVLAGLSAKATTAPSLTSSIFLYFLE